MSNLTQAKREAKRLFNIAKSNDNNLNIKSLNEAQKILAIINGYKDWYDFEIALHKKDALISSKEKQVVHQYLSDEDKYNLKRYYTDNHVFNKQIFIEHTYQHNTAKHENVGFTLGVKIEKNKKLFSKEVDITFRPRNAALWGDGAKYDGREILIKYMSSNACINIAYSDTLSPILYQNLSLDEDILKRLLFLNLNINATFTNTIDPINPFIEFKTEFLTSFCLPSEHAITRIFYALCIFFHEKKCALTSKELQCFLSLKWLSNFDEDVKIKEKISSYLFYLKLSVEDIQDEYFFENKNQEIQNHHTTIFQTQKILDSIAKFEKKGIFSPESQIDFDDILYQKKVLFINHPNSSEIRPISNIINCLFLKKLQCYNQYYANVIPRNRDSMGQFTCFSLIQDMDLFLNDDTYPLFLACSSDITNNWFSPFFFTFESFENLNVKYENILVNTLQHIFSKIDYPMVPRTLAQKVLYHCSNVPESLFNEYNSPLKSLTSSERYYMGKYQEKFEDYKKVPLGVLNNKYEIYHLNIKVHSSKRNTEISFNNFANIRKIAK